jgi:hypothetical protein
MKWFRTNVKHGSRLALFALAIQFALAFGHFHGAAVLAGPAVQSDAARTHSANADLLSAPDAINRSSQQPASNHDSDQHPSDACAICAVIALANTALFATPPLFLLPQANEFVYLATGAEFFLLNSARVAFQPRAPPVS